MTSYSMASAPWRAALVAAGALALSLTPPAASPALAQDSPDPSTQKTVEAGDLMESRTLENGLDVIVISDPTLPIVTIELTVKNGAYTETAELNGLSHLYEHMFFKGNAVIPNQEAYLERMRELGIVFNGTTSSERVNYFFTLPAANLTPGLQFMYDATTSPNFDEAEFEREKQVVLGEADRAESSPYYWLNRGVEQLLWHTYPARKDPLGSREAIINATVEQMRRMKELYYVPNNSVVMVAGDVEPEAAFEAVEAVFGQWERAEDPFTIEPVPPHPPLADDSYVVVEREVQVPVFQFNWHGPSVGEDPVGTHAADVLSYILSQPTSKFYKALVDSQLTLGASKSYYTQAFTGPISLTAQALPEQFYAAMEAALIEVSRFADPDYFTDEQLEAAKTILAVQEIYGREQTSSFAHTVTFWWAVAGLDYYRSYIADLEAVTREDIANYVRTYILDQPMVVGALASPEQVESLGLSEERLQEVVESVRARLENESSDTSDSAENEGGQ
ncbi:insulinase family protein [Lujinxingia vulgaris]|uniref:Insulinase family protein n=1 Tax=Lujinxingia vulgaris TaxID=2600176 RepID=A0A5C6X8U2_9DELT|nr:pitrilysin family protein [Lujinxingia vulgaris]TXD37778.1 insulinase family protein [Lujinxingia vulgaris]